jgi:hypothetical protein
VIWRAVECGADADESAWEPAPAALPRRIDGFHQELTILNHESTPVDIVARVDAAADFADLFEVKDHLGEKGRHYHRTDGHRLLLGRERDTFRRETIIRSSEPAEYDRNGLTLNVHIGPHGEGGPPTWTW